MFFRKKRESPWIGMAAGLIGGLAGSIAIGKFHEWWAGMTQSNLVEKGMDSTTKAAEAVSEGVLKQPLSEEAKPKAASAVHFAFGGTMGALYGAAAALEPKVAGAFGMPFGASVYAGAHATAVPALGLSAPITQSRVSDEAGEVIGHFVYGLVTDLTRRGVLAAVKAL